MAKRITDLPERFLTKIDPSPSGCWLWTGHRDHHGYGRVRWNGRTRFAHRIVYELLVGPIPKGLVSDHLCRVRACVNPHHIEPVTQRENSRRGESHNGRKTHCPQGHPYSGDNLYVKPTGERVCRSCHRIRERMRIPKEEKR